MSAPDVPVGVAPPAARNPFGVVSIVLAVVLLAVTILTRILTVAAPAMAQSLHLGIGAVSGLLNGVGIVGVVVALAAAVVGIVGVTRPGLPKALAAAGMGIGITAAASYVLVYALDNAVAVALEPR
jgi:hypothetical protein